MQPFTFPDFLGSELGQTKPANALFHVIPAPYEKSVSYGTGAAGGPSAILEASQQLELYDGFSIPAECGIFTHPALGCEGTHETALTEIADAVKTVLGQKKIPVLLGGEHTVTVGALKALQEQNHATLGIVQFDAHADLRDTYEGSPFSHACVMRRALDMGFTIYQIGVRSLSHEEESLRQKKNIGRLDAREIALSGLPEPILPADFPETIYITIDVDGLDPSVIPATGTPEPGGLSWYQMMQALESIIRQRNVIGLDVVELAPIAGMHAADFAAARLIYNTMGMIVRNRSGSKCSRAEIE